MILSSKIPCSWTAEVGTDQTKKNLGFIRNRFEHFEHFFHRSDLPNKSSHRNDSHKRYTDIGSEIYIVLLGG